MRSAKRRARDERPLGREQACDRMDPRYLECLGRREQREDPGQPPPEHRLAGAGRTGQEEVVTTCRGELEGSPGPFLPADVGEIGWLRLERLVGLLDRGRLQLAPQIGDRLAEMSDRHRLHTRKLGFGRRLGRTEDQVEAEAARTLGNGECTAHRPNASVQSELANRGMLRKALRRHLSRGRQHRQGDREVEARSFLAQARRSEVDRDPTVEWPLQRARRDSAPNPMFRLLAGTVGQADDREPRHAALEVRLDLHPPRLETDESVGDGAREHAFDATPEAVTEELRLRQGCVAIRIDSKYSPERRPVRLLT